MRHIRTAVFALASVLTSLAASGNSRPLKSFTVAEEIGLAHFLHPPYSQAAMISPDGRFIALQPAERGLLTEDLVEDELRVYAVSALREFIVNKDQLRVPAAVLDLRESTYKDGPIISEVQWLPDSSGLAFLLRNKLGTKQLVVMRLGQRYPRTLSLKGQNVTTFDVRDSTHYVYTVLAPGSVLRLGGENGWTSIVGTGHVLVNLLNPTEELARMEGEGFTNGLRSILWAAVGDPPHLVISRETNKPIVIYPVERWLALSPGGQTLATAIPVPEVPERWVRKFPPPYADYPIRMLAGYQNLDVTLGSGAVASEYVLIDLRSGAESAVNGAPTGWANGWWGEEGAPEWSANGKAVLLPNTYLQPTGGRHYVAQPCAAVFYPAIRAIKCLRHLTRPGKVGSVMLGPIQFVGGRSDKIVVDFLPEVQGTPISKPEVYLRTVEGRWQVTNGSDAPETHRNSVNVYVKQGLNEPPVVVAADPGAGASRVIWDPNPQLKNIALGEAAVYKWEDPSGRAWRGGLYKPGSYVPGRRYPLVIQTHGFSSSAFHPSGMWPTAFAARALAASGMFVLQVPMKCVLEGTKEGPCNTDGFIGAVRQLSSQGLVDPNRVGLIGFSRTTYYVLEALTTSQTRFAAAAVTDGETYGYMQYLAFLDEYPGNGEASAADTLIGGKPFGSGLQAWLKRSPEFNMQKVHTPLLVTSLGRLSLIYVWEPYAVLRYLGKPVDLVILNSDEHVLTNPSARLASQGGSVDWFRFWLQGYEDPDPAKDQQYRRWEKLCDMQTTRNPGHSTWCVLTKGHLASRSKSAPSPVH